MGTEKRNQAGNSTTAPRSFFARRGGGIGILRKALREKRPLILLLDYDGTLASIRVEASRAKLEQPVRALLGRLAESPRVRVGIISGRAMDDLLDKVRLENVFYAGDDRTDEDAFRALRPLGLTVRVGRTRETEAEYYVENRAGVIEILKTIERGIRPGKRRAETTSAP